MTDDATYWRAPAGVRRGYAETRFGQMHYRVASPEEAGATPLLCLHSSPSSGRMYAELVARIGRDRLALAPDTPGFGESDAPAEAPGIADYAAAMTDFCAAMGVDRTDVIGTHTGCKIAVELALQRPDLVRRLILVSAPVYTERELARQKQAFDEREIAEDGSHLTQRWQWMLRYRAPETPLSLMQRNMVETLRGGETAWWGHRAAFAYHHAENLPKVAQPVLVFNPDDDLTRQTARAGDYLKNGTVMPLPGWSHGFMDTHADEFADLVRAFLDGPAADAAPEIEPLALAPPPPPRPRRPLRRTFIDGPHGQIHVRLAEPAQAAAPALVCFHMSPNSGRIYEAFLAEMGRDRIAVAPDTPGFGESDFPATRPSIEDYAAAMAQVVETLGLGTVDVMGYHTGSMTAVELALARPDLVRRVVMVSAPLYTDEEREIRLARNRAEEWQENGSHLAKRWNFMRQFYGPGVPIAVFARNYAEGARGGPLSWWGHRAAFTYPLAHTLPAVKQPVLVLGPDDDLAEQTPRAAALLRRGRLQPLPGWSHGMLDIHTAKVAGIVRAFLSEF